ncbi:MAG: AAA family ATPase, partial [Clostridiales bacterium]|nr:AAA family ATPase [Clostridiales bacterium]
NIPLVRFDMSEYQESHAVARLIGSPPGYVGYDEGGLMVDAVRKTPHCVLLLDEIEKAHANIMNVLLQVMDYGKLTDNSGKKADFRNVIIIMTSNAGAKEADRKVIGFGGGVNLAAMGREVNRVFAPEFRNRLNQIVYFNPVDREMAAKIARKALGILSNRLAEKNIRIEATEDALEFIAKEGFSAAQGAREIMRLVEGPIKEKIVEALLSDGPDEGTIKLVLQNEEIFIEILGTNS